MANPFPKSGKQLFVTTFFPSTIQPVSPQKFYLNISLRIKRLHYTTLHASRTSKAYSFHIEDTRWCIICFIKHSCVTMIQIYLRHDPIQMGHIFEQVEQSALRKLSRCLK